jgi:hypothetical protein
MKTFPPALPDLSTGQLTLVLKIKHEWLEHDQFRAPAPGWPFQPATYSTPG